MKNKVLFAVLFLVMTVSAFGQSFPRPYVVGGFNLMPAGYASTSFGTGGGIMWDQPHFVLDTYAGYDTGHKDNDGTSDNYSGHDRYLRGFGSYKQGNNYFGIGARWSELYTTNYDKSGSWHPEVGAGHDFSPLRLQVAYMFRESKEVTQYPGGIMCDGCGNASQGADITLWFPSPARSKHLFAKMNVVLFEFHDTITDPSNTLLTQQQISNKHFTDSTEFMVGYRF